MIESIKQPKKLLVAGGNGFIGRWVTKGGVERGYETTALDLSVPENERCVEGVSYIAADLRDLDSLSRTLAVQGFTHVVNLSGYINHSKFLEGGQDVLDVHFGGVLNLVHSLDWEALESFVQIGSSDEYGSLPAPQHEEMKEAPISSYSLGKLASGQFLQMLNRTEGFPATILRLFLVYGPGQELGRFLPQIILSCLGGDEFPVSEGEQLRDFCFIEDVVTGIFTALESSDIDGEVFNLASGQPLSIRSVVEQVVQIIGGGTPKFGVIPYRTGENMKLYADVGKITKSVGWKPSVSIDEGIRRTIAAYRNYT